MGTLITLLMLAAAPAVSIEYDHQADFSRYRTWSWHREVTPAANPLADKRIQEAIEKGLAARGLSRTDGDGALLVQYHASKTTEIGLVPMNTAAGFPSTGIQYAEKGSLVVALVDAASGNVVWRGWTAGALNYDPFEVAAQVKEAAEKLLERFPPPASPLVP